MTSTEERPERSVPKPVFTDAEAGAKEFPDSGPSARRYNYFKPAKRKQTHYEDVTVEVQPDPRHYLSQGWIYGFADGTGGYPLTWTKLKAWGVDEPEPERGPGSGGRHVADWPAHGWHEFRDPNEEWELTMYRYNANVVRQITQNVENARNAKAFDQWTPNWVRFVERNVGAWMHIEHILGLYVFAACNRSGPTNMHNTVMAVNSEHKIRFAQDLALYNLTLTEEIEGFDGSRARRRVEQRRRSGRASASVVRGADRGGRRLGRVDLRHEHRVRAAARRALPLRPRHAVGGRQRRLRDADRHGRRRVRLRPARPALDGGRASRR